MYGIPWMQCRTRRILATMNRTKTLHLLTAACCTLMFGTAAAQVTFVNAPDTVVGYLDVPEDDELSEHLDVQNTSGDTLVLMLTRLYVDTVSPYNYPYSFGAEGAYDRFCWGPLCYNYGSDNSSASANLLVTMAPGEVNNTLVADYYYNGVAGMSTLRYCLHGVEQDPEAGSCHDVTFQVDQNLSVATSESLLPELTCTGPNQWSYHLLTAERGALEVHDLMGRLVWRQQLLSPAGTVALPASEWKSGQYVLSLEAAGVRTTNRVFITGR